MTDQELLGAFEHLMRTQPPRANLYNEDTPSLAWLGYAVALINAWDKVQGVAASFTVDNFHNPTTMNQDHAYTKLMVQIHRAQADLRMKTIGPVNVALGTGMVFKYFDTLTQLIAGAASDVFFIDPYLDAEFVSRYLPQIRQGVAVRLLTGTKQSLLNALRPALSLFNTQQNANATARSTSGLHDRYVFIDSAAAYQSGASFKDGAVNAPTALIQITDAFAAIKDTYEQMWLAATPI
jgi:hypothetical protein